MPTIASWLVDATPRRYAARTVLGLNFAGVAPYVVKLWAGKNDIVSAGKIVTDPFALIVMFGAAGIGWMMFMAFPGVVAGLSSMNARRRIAQLKEHQRTLVEEWGAAVAQDRRAPQVPEPLAEAAVLAPDKAA
jgi:hypothetical protein